MAAGFLERRGAVVLGRNLRAGRGEVDLLVRLGATPVAVEVKTRRGGEGDPVDSFTHAKAARVRRAAARLHPPAHRVDLVTVALHADGVTVRWLPEIG